MLNIEKIKKRMSITLSRHSSSWLLSSMHLLYLFYHEILQSWLTTVTYRHVFSDFSLFFPWMASCDHVNESPLLTHCAELCMCKRFVKSLSATLKFQADIPTTGADPAFLIKVGGLIRKFSSQILRTYSKESSFL